MFPVPVGLAKLHVDANIGTASRPSGVYATAGIEIKPRMESWPNDVTQRCLNNPTSDGFRQQQSEQCQQPLVMYFMCHRNNAEESPPKTLKPWVLMKTVLWVFRCKCRLARWPARSWISLVNSFGRQR